MTNHATYSPEDNKLRMYPGARLPADLYARVKAAGFSWAPKQELFVAPAWTPEREDMLIELCGEIGDEDTSLVERQEQRAERFEEYSERREREAHAAKDAVDAIADGIPLGQPILVGHHSERHARRDAERIESGMRKAVNLWETSRYWEDRARGAIHHAKYKERPDVRARRIKGLEADKRKQEKEKAGHELRLKFWRGELKTKDGGTLPVNRDTALWFCNRYDHAGVLLPTGETEWSAWSALDGDKVDAEYVKARRLDSLPRLIAYCNRWLSHLDNRLAYERAMQAESGGIATDKAKPEKGGACRCWCSPGHGNGWSYIRKVNKVSVTVEDNWGNGGKNFTRTIPFDKLTALMSKADVDALRAKGSPYFAESFDGAGFFCADGTLTPKARMPEEPTVFDAMADTLKAGVQAVVVPHLFPTPPDLARRVVELANISEGHTVLEPSAGTGNLLRAVRESVPHTRLLYAVEINHHLVSACAGSPPLADEVRCADFLQCNGDMGTFDRVVMNPPFANGQDIAHIQHALSMLAPNGRLVAICANGPRQREQLMPEATAWHDLPPGSFTSEGTSVNAAIVVFDKE